MNSETPPTPLQARLNHAREQLENWNTLDFQDDEHKAAELLFVEFCIELVTEPYLTPAGLKRIEERIGWSEEFITRNVTDSEGEE